jgi:DNA-binding NarL/FixJ family response regulator
MTSGEKIKRIVIIHEHTIAREGLRLLVERRADFAVVGEGRNCAEVMELVLREQPHVLLVDADLHDNSSMAFLPKLIAVSPKSRILILTSEREPELHNYALRSGASGVFYKDQDSDVFIEAIDKVIEEEVLSVPETVSDVPAELRRNNLDDENERWRIASLTRRELEVISVFGMGLTTKEIAERLFISEKTVRNHFTSIFGKLSVSHRLELLVYAQKHGLL